MNLLIENLNLTLIAGQTNASLYPGDNLIMQVARINCGSDSQQWPSGLQLNAANELQYLTGEQSVNHNYQNFIYLPPDVICSQKDANLDGTSFGSLPKNSRFQVFVLYI